jgi:hypothetical protein
LPAVIADSLLSKNSCFALCKESTPVLQYFQIIQSRKACNSGGDWVAVCKPVISDFARKSAAIARLSIAQFNLQNYHQKTAIVLGSAHPLSNKYKVHFQLHWKSLCRR